tara:strand:- start:1027 stop:1206 length:180 start_codon:yes stop_codon:yes gene_type:complete
MIWAFVVAVMFVSLSFMGCLIPDDKRTIIDEKPIKLTNMFVANKHYNLNISYFIKWSHK